MFAARISTLLLISTSSTYGHSCVNDTFKVEVWHNWTEFSNGGWYIPVNAGDPYSFDKPSLLRTSLSYLDAGSSWGTWTGKNPSGAMGGYMYYRLNTTARPEYMGLTEAIITIKYFSTSTSQMKFSPCEGPSHQCSLENSDIISGKDAMDWKTAHIRVNMTPIIESQQEMYIYGVSQWKLLDEVQLTHNGGIEDCKDYCNTTCEYVAIDCHNYYSCVNFTKQHFNCSQELGLAFNPQLGVCDFMQNVEGCDCGRCEYRPHQNCSNYYFCPDTCKEELCEMRTCPRGLVWNKDGTGHQQCTLPEFATSDNCTRTDRA